MQLIITQQVFVWIFGILGVLFALILLLVLIALGYTVALLKLANEKSKEVAETVDEVRNSVHEVVHSFDQARDHVASFVGAAMNASTIANIIRTVRNAWHNGNDTQQKPSDDVDDIFADISIKAPKPSDKKRSS